MEAPTESTAKPLSSLLKHVMERFVFTGSPSQITEYSDLIAEVSKMVTQPYIVVHKRIERMFAQGTSADTVLSHLRQWSHEARKHEKPGMIINARMKQYRESNTPISV